MPRFLNISKKITQSAVRRLSNDLNESTHHDQLGSWIKIYGNMRQEAGAIAESAVSGTKMDVGLLRAEVKADVGMLRSELTQVKADVASVKADVNDLKADVNDLRKGQIDIHREITNNTRQINNNTRLLLGAMFGTATLFFGANRYLDNQKSREEKPSQAVALVK